MVSKSFICGNIGNGYILESEKVSASQTGS